MLVEAVLLLGIAIPLWAKNVQQFPDAKDATVIQIMAQQFAWNVRYPGPDGKFGRQDMKLVSDDNVFGVDPADPAGKDDIQVLNEIHVPVNKPVLIYLSSKDVIHSLKLVAMRITQDAIPGLRIPLHVHAHENRPLPDRMRAALRQRPRRDGRRFSRRAKPGRLRRVAELQVRRRRPAEL